MTVVKQLMVGSAKDKLETWEEDLKDDDEDGFNELLGEVLDYATKRRLEANKGNGDPMDLGEVG